MASTSKSARFTSKNLVILFRATKPTSRRSQVAIHRFDPLEKAFIGIISRVEPKLTHYPDLIGVTGD